MSITSIRTNSTSVSQLRGCSLLLVVVAFVRGWWGDGRGSGGMGVTPWGPLSYLPLHLLRPLTPFENTTPHSLGFHGAIQNLVRLRRDTERR